MAIERNQLTMEVDRVPRPHLYIITILYRLITRKMCTRVARTLKIIIFVKQKRQKNKRARIEQENYLVWRM